MSISTYGGESIATMGRNLLRSLLLSSVLMFSAVRMMGQDNVRAFRFVENIGQWDEETALMGTNSQALLRFRRTAVDWWYPVRDKRSGEDKTAKGYGLTTEFVGASEDAAVSGEEGAGAVWNYYLGSRPDEQFTGARDYRSVRYHGIYPHIDALF